MYKGSGDSAGGASGAANRRLLAHYTNTQNMGGRRFPANYARSDQKRACRRRQTLFIFV